jgi:ribulose-phosphate 3-epimerase
VLNPHTPEDLVRYVLEDVDLVLVMSVNPGFGGQSFLKEALPKLRALRRMIDATGKDIVLEVDGGVGPETAAAVVDAGARMLVAGSAVYHSRDYGVAIEAIRSAGTSALVGPLVPAG